jgi:hypothetical protein
MVNNYDLEYSLLKKSQIVDRAPRSIIGDKDITNDYELVESDKEEKKES